MFHSPEQTNRRRGAKAVAAVAAALTLAVAAFLLFGDDEAAPAGTERIAGLQTIEVNGAGDHTTETVDYAVRPPAGGPHHPIWQNCGFYSEPIEDEHAVHSMEHGAVWIAYDPGLNTASLDTIGTAVHSRSYLLASPYPGVDGVILSAWGYRLELGEADDPRFETFIAVFAGSRHVPEPGGPCHGGIGSPR